MLAASIIIPTLATRERRPQLSRAIQSALAASSAHAVKVIVCVNGNRYDGEAVREMENTAGVEVHLLAEGSLPKAISFGRSMVATPFFGFLDDDDELLPSAVDQRLEVLARDDDRDLVVSNGIRRSSGGDRAYLADLQLVPASPMEALFRENWLASCGALYRTQTVGPQYFEDLHRYAEWTWLAFALTLDGKRVAVLDVPTFVVNDTPGSLSKSPEYRRTYLDLCRRMLSREPPRGVRSLIRRRMARALHDLSDDFLQEGQWLRAATLHARSLAMPGGIRYLTYSRHLVAAAVRGIARSRSDFG